MTQVIKAIETRYKGCRFRSRLEARWAVLFDAIGAEWEYEKEGFDVNGTLYLPDFWVPFDPEMEPDFCVGYGSWVEIKPTPICEQQFQLYADLARLSGHRVLVLCGSPWPGKHKGFMFQHHHWGMPADIPFVVGEVFEVDSLGGGTNCSILLGARTPSEFFCPPDRQGYAERRDTHFPNGRVCCHKRGTLDRAFHMAYGARFEHGETP